MSLKDDWKSTYQEGSDLSGTWLCMRTEHAIANVHTPDAPDPTQTTC